MKCPFCRETGSHVYNSRSTKFATQTWRRRRCRRCGRSFTTYEAPDLGFLSVIKRSGQAQPYSRAKLYSSLYNAFSASVAPASTMDAITDTIEANVLDMRSESVTTRDIARLSLVALKHFDQGAFLRYLASQPELARDTAFKRELRRFGA